VEQVMYHIDINDKTEFRIQRVMFTSQYFKPFLEEIANATDIYATIAGGAVISVYCSTEDHTYNDIDIYVSKSGEFVTLKNHFIKHLGYDIVNNIPTSQINSEAKFSYCRLQKNKASFANIDLMYCPLSTNKVSELLDSFDFTICKTAVTLNKKLQDNIKYVKFSYHPLFFDHIESKELWIDNKIKRPDKILSRLQKYIKKGYSAPDETLSKIYTEIQHTLVPKVPTVNLNIQMQDAKKENDWDIKNDSFKLNTANDILGSGNMPVSDVPMSSIPVSGAVIPGSNIHSYLPSNAPLSILPQTILFSDVAIQESVSPDFTLEKTAQEVVV
jgi:hypothetical protein